MDNKIVEKRIAFLRQMDDYILEYDSLWDAWEEEKTKLLYQLVSERGDLWRNLCKKFGELTEDVLEEEKD